MVSEATIIELLGHSGDPIQVTVANATGISKGTLMVLPTDPRTAVASADADAVGGAVPARPFIGIAAHDKEASDGSTRLTVYTNLIADIYVGGAAVNMGDKLGISGANIVDVQNAAGVISCSTVGMALETGSVDEQIAVLVRVGT